MESRARRVGRTNREVGRAAAYDDPGDGPPGGPKPLAVERMEECLVALFHIEKGDSASQAELLARDIRKIAQKVGATRLMISGFAHLSHSRPDLAVAKELYFLVFSLCQGWEGFEVRSSHFGWNKSLLLDVKGHATAFNFRSYEPSEVKVKEEMVPKTTKRYQPNTSEAAEAVRAARIARRAARREGAG